jgi:hypothetical protein
MRRPVTVDRGGPLDILRQALTSEDDDVLYEALEFLTPLLKRCALPCVHNFIVPVLGRLIDADNCDVVRAALLALPAICTSLFTRFPDVAYDLMSTTFLDFVRMRILCVNQSLVTDIAECFTALVASFEPLDIRNIAFPMITEFLDAYSKHVRVVAAEILSLLADTLNVSDLGGDITAIVGQLCGDETSTLRRRVPELVCRYLSRLAQGKLTANLCGRFPLLVRDTSPHVRLEVAKFLLPLSEKLAPMQRRITIAPAIMQLLDDSDESVREAATKSLGMLVAHLGKAANAELIARYAAAMTSSDLEVSRAVAAAFPSVAVALGPRNWAVIENVFSGGLSSEDFQVRRSLAFGLGQFGAMLDPDRLATCALDLASDAADVAIGVLSNLTVLLPLVPDAKPFLAFLSRPIERYPKWRTRREVSKQLRLCAQFFERGALIESAGELLRDEVGRVRDDAVLSFVELMEVGDLAAVRELAQHRHWVHRLTAAAVFGRMRADVVKEGVDVFAALGRDRVANVRVAAARSFGNVAAGLGEEIETLEELRKGMEEDRDLDVRNAVAAK